MIGGIVISHGTMSTCLIETIETIYGNAEALAALSNIGLSTRELTETLRDTSKKMNVESIVYFVDVFGGSCWQAAKMAKNRNDHIITGVNVPMILSFLHKRNDTSPDTIHEVLDSDGKRGIISE